MQIVNQAAELICEPDGYRQIERVGRTCYKSEDRISDGSAVKFCQMMKNSHHYAMLEHHVVHLHVTDLDAVSGMFMIEMPSGTMPYSAHMAVSIVDNTDLQRTTLEYVITASIRTMLEILEDPATRTQFAFTLPALQAAYPEMFGNISNEIIPDYFVCDVKVIDDAEVIRLLTSRFLELANAHDLNYEISRHLFHTMRFTTDRGVSHEMVRHRTASFAQESTRYCNYTKGKFGSEICVINPGFFADDDIAYGLWKHACETDERNYFQLIDRGFTAQQARSVLPTSLKCDLIVTASELEWQHIIDLRYIGTTGAPHPQIRELMELAKPSLETASNSRLSFETGSD